MATLVIDAIFAILGRMGIVLGLAQGIQGLLSSSNPNGQTDLIIKQTEKIIMVEGDLGSSLTAIQDSINELADMVVALGSPQQTGSDVTLPAVPPGGYGGASASDVADQVWNDHQPLMESTPGDALLQVARSLNTTAVFQMPLYAGVFMVERIQWPTTGWYIHDLNYPVFDAADILLEESLLECMARQNPTWNCSQVWLPQSYVTLEPTDGSIVYYTTVIDDAGFDRLKFYLYTPSSGLPQRSTLGDTSQLLALIPLQY